MTTPRGAPELAAAQAIPETTVNEQVRHTEAGACFFPVVDKDLTAPPGSCADGASYIVGAAATGLWSGKTDQIATAVGTNAASGWLYHAELEGLFAYVQDENALYYSDGTAWAVFSGGGGGASAIDDLTDVDTTGVADGDVLTYDSGASEWVPAAPSGGSVIASVNASRSWLPSSGGTTPTVHGMTVTGTGILSRTSATTNRFTSENAVRALSSSSAGNGAGARNTAAIFNRAYGFTLNLRFGLIQRAATTSVFAGIGPTTELASAQATTFTDIVGVGADSADTNLYVIHNDASGTATKVDTGFPINTTSTDLYEVNIAAAAGGSVEVTVTRLNTGAEFTTTVSTDLPATSVLLSWQQRVTNLSTAANVEILLGRVLAVTDA